MYTIVSFDVVCGLTCVTSIFCICILYLHGVYYVVLSYLLSVCGALCGFVFVYMCVMCEYLMYVSCAYAKNLVHNVHSHVKIVRWCSARTVARARTLVTGLW